MAVKREVVVITPEVAQQYLDTININRDPTQSHEDLHVRQMEAGQWDDDITIVYINEHGELIDCAKRLRALIRADYTAEWLVISGVRDTAQDKLDVGEFRTVGQSLQMKGVANPNECGSFGRVVWDWQTRDTRGIGKGMKPPPFEVVNLVLSGRKEFTNAVPVAKKIKKKLPAVNQPVVGALYCLLRAKHPDTPNKEGLATQFFGELEFPPRTEPGNPARVLNTHLQRIEDKQEDRPSKTACLWLLVRAWQCYVEYQTGNPGRHMRPADLIYPGGRSTVSVADIPRIDEL